MMEESSFRESFLTKTRSLRLVRSSHDCSISWVYIFDKTTTPFFAIPTSNSILRRTEPSNSTEKLVLENLIEHDFFSIDKVMDVDDTIKSFEDFGLLEQGSTHDLLNQVTSSNVPLAMYRVICDLVNYSSNKHHKRLIGNGGNVSIMSILLDSYQFSRDLDHDIRYNAFSMGWKHNGVMLLHPTLVVSPEVENGNLWRLNISGIGVDDSNNRASLRRFRIRASNSTECERWINRISASTCLATSTEIAMFLDAQIRSVLEIRRLLVHELDVGGYDDIHQVHVGWIFVKTSSNNISPLNRERLYWCELNFHKSKFFMYPDCVSRQKVLLEISLQTLVQGKEDDNGELGEDGEFVDEKRKDEEEKEKKYVIQIFDSNKTAFQFIFKIEHRKSEWESAIRYAIQIRKRRERRRKSTGRNAIRDVLGVSSSPSSSPISSSSTKSSFKSSSATNKSSLTSSSTWLKKTFECAEQYLKTLRREHDAVVRILQDFTERRYESNSPVPHLAKRIARTIQKESVSGRTVCDNICKSIFDVLARQEGLVAAHSFVTQLDTVWESIRWSRSPCRASSSSSSSDNTKSVVQFESVEASCGDPTKCIDGLSSTCWQVDLKDSEKNSETLRKNTKDWIVFRLKEMCSLSTMAIRFGDAYALKWIVECAVIHDDDDDDNNNIKWHHVAFNTKGVPDWSWVELPLQDVGINAVRLTILKWGGRFSVIAKDGSQQRVNGSIREVALYGTSYIPKHLTFTRKDRLRQASRDLKLRSEQFLLTPQGRKLHFIATTEIIQSSSNVVQEMYTTAFKATSKPSTTGEHNSFTVEPNDLPYTLFASHPILEFRKKIRLVEGLATRARYRFWMISKSLHLSSVLRFRGRVAMVRPNFVSGRIEAVAIAGPPLLDGARSWQFEITSGTANFGFCSGVSTKRFRFDDCVAGPTIEFKAGSLVRVSAVCKKNSTIDLYVFWRASRKGHEHKHKHWTLHADVKNPCCIVPAVGLTTVGSGVRILPSDEWKKSDLAGNVSYEDHNLEVLESTVINRLCDAKQKPHHTLLATLYTLHSSFYIYRNPRDSVSDMTHTHISTKLWTSVSCYPLQHQGTVMYNMKGNEWIECNLQLVKSELVLSFDDSKTTSKSTKKLVVNTASSKSSTTTIRLRLWNSPESGLQGSSMNVVAVSSSSSSTPKSSPRTSSKLFLFKVFCQENSNTKTRRTFRFAAKNGRSLRLWLNRIDKVLDAAQWKRRDCSVQLLNSGLTCPDSWIDCSPAICTADLQMPIVSSSTLRRWTVGKTNHGTLRFVFSQSSDHHDHETCVVHFSSVKPQREGTMEEKENNTRDQILREASRLQDLLPKSENGLVDLVLKSVDMSFSEAQLHIKDNFGENVWNSIEDVVTYSTSPRTKSIHVRTILERLSTALFRTTFSKRQDKTLSFWQTRTWSLDFHLYLRISRIRTTTRTHTQVHSNSTRAVTQFDTSNREKMQRNTLDVLVHLKDDFEVCLICQVANLQHEYMVTKTQTRFY